MGNVFVKCKTIIKQIGKYDRLTKNGHISYYGYVIQ